MHTIILFLASFLPPPHADCLTELDCAEQWQVAMFAAKLPSGHAGLDDAADRVELWENLEWSTSDVFSWNERADAFGAALGLRIGRGRWHQWE
jgi:hypothetical protein